MFITIFINMVINAVMTWLLLFLVSNSHFRLKSETLVLVKPAWDSSCIVTELSAQLRASAGCTPPQHPPTHPHNTHFIPPDRISRSSVLEIH